VDALKRFNRKERNILIRYVLGDAENGLRLGEKFREDLLDALTVTVREDAWWATDYHINWLAAALDLYLNGEESVGGRFAKIHRRRTAASLSRGIKKMSIW